MYVCFRRGGAAGIHYCFINDAASEALHIKGATVRLLTVAAPRLVITLRSCPTYTDVVVLNNSANVRHAAVADLDRAPIFMCFGAYRKMPVNEPWKLLPYPGNPSCLAPLWTRFFLTFLVSTYSTLFMDPLLSVDMVMCKPRLLKDLVISFLAHSALLPDIPLKQPAHHSYRALYHIYYTDLEVGTNVCP